MLALALFAVLAQTPDAFEAKAIGIADGDTVTVLRGRKQIRVRIEGIDCPEKGQPFGRRAKDFTAGLILRKVVRIRPYTTDQYGRMVARVIVDGKDVSRELLRAGLAWYYKRFNQEPELKELEREARQVGRGLWSDRNPIPPWEWRRAKR